MKQPGWRPHQRGSSMQDWSPRDWEIFTQVTQMFAATKSRKPRNRGNERKRWYADKKAGLNPQEEKAKRRRVQTPSAIPHEEDESWGQWQASDATAVAATAASAPAAPEAMVVSPEAASMGEAPFPPVPPGFIYPPPPWAMQPLVPQPKARPVGCPVILLGPHRPRVVNPRGLTLTVDRDMLRHLLDSMQPGTGGSSSSRSRSVAALPPIEIFDEEEEEEEDEHME